MLVQQITSEKISIGHLVFQYCLKLLSMLLNVPDLMLYE